MSIVGVINVLTCVCCVVILICLVCSHRALLVDQSDQLHDRYTQHTLIMRSALNLASNTVQYTYSVRTHRYSISMLYALHIYRHYKGVRRYYAAAHPMEHRSCGRAHHGQGRAPRSVHRTSDANYGKASVGRARSHSCQSVPHTTAVA